MIINSLSVVSSLLQRGEDPLLGRAELAVLFNINKRDLTAARERTGCYSLTRYHLNQAAELLGIKPTDLVYRISPSMLKADASGKAEISGTDAQVLGASNVNSGELYRASIDTNPDMMQLMGDLTGAISGGEFNPKDYVDRFDKLKSAVDANGGSYAAGLLGVFSSTPTVRYNAGRITEWCAAVTPSPTVATNSAGYLHLMLGIFGAFSTGIVLNNLRRYISTGALSRYDETDHLSRWLTNSVVKATGSRVLMGVRSTSRPNAKLDTLIDATMTSSRILREGMDPALATDFVSRSNYEDATVTRTMEAYIDGFVQAFSAMEASGKTLDIDALVKRANKLLRSTPQLVSQQA